MELLPREVCADLVFRLVGPPAAEAPTNPKTRKVNDKTFDNLQHLAGRVGPAMGAVSTAVLYVLDLSMLRNALCHPPRDAISLLLAGFDSASKGRLLAHDERGALAVFPAARLVLGGRTAAANAATTTAF